MCSLWVNVASTNGCLSSLVKHKVSYLSITEKRNPNPNRSFKKKWKRKKQKTQSLPTFIKSVFYINLQQPFFFFFFCCSAAPHGRSFPFLFNWTLFTLPQFGDGIFFLFFRCRISGGPGLPPAMGHPVLDQLHHLHHQPTDAGPEPNRRLQPAGCGDAVGRWPSSRVGSRRVSKVSTSTPSPRHLFRNQKSSDFKLESWSLRESSVLVWPSDW